MKPVILFREELETEGELSICSSILPTVRYRTEIQSNSTVIGRYSVLPFYKELAQELALKNSLLINSYEQHTWVTNVMEWAGQGGTLEGFTPQSWPNWAHLPEGSYILKGATNSRKFQWNTHMFAPTRADIPKIASRLLDDQMIRDQGLVVREYIPLKQLSIGLNGLPITNEWRTFWYVVAGKPRLVAKGFYWQATHPELEPQASFPTAAELFARRAAVRVAEHVNFFVLDIAETASGDWIVVEVNDGQMSGLCGCDPEALYKNLKMFTSASII